MVSEVTGDHDIQTQKVDGTNQVIIKTRSLELAERQELETALEENFGVTTQDIQSQNIGSAISSEMRTQSVVAVVIAAFFMLLISGSASRYPLRRKRDLALCMMCSVC